MAESIKYINVKIRKFVRCEIDHLSDKIAIRDNLNKDAIEAAKNDINIRLEAMNKVRGQLQDQAKTFVSKEELKLVEKDISMLSKLVYVGLGVWLLLQVIIVTVMSLLFK